MVSVTFKIDLLNQKNHHGALEKGPYTLMDRLCVSWCHHMKVVDINNSCAGYVVLKILCYKKD